MRVKDLPEISKYAYPVNATRSKLLYANNFL